MKKERAAVEGTDLIGIVTGEGDPVLDHVAVMDIADATSIALDHVTANVHAQEIRVTVRQDGADQEAEKIAVQRASGHQISPHRISAQTMSRMAMEQKPRQRKRKHRLPQVMQDLEEPMMIELEFS